MATDSAKTTSTTIAQAIKDSYYDELFLKVARAKLVHKQLGQRNKMIEKGEGGYGTGVVVWTQWTDLADVSAGQGEGVPTTAVSLSATNVTGSTAQYDNAVSISDITAYVSMGDIMKEAINKLAYNAGKSIDNIVRAATYTSGTQINASGLAAAAWTGIPAAATLDILGIRKAKRSLERNDAYEQMSGGWMAVVHPDSLYDLQADTTTGGWIDANKYTDANAGKLLSGEVGQLLGVKFLASSNAAVRGTGVVASATIYVTSIFGTDAFGVTELQGLKTFIKGFGSAGTADPTDKVATAGWKTTFGAQSLNSSFYVNYNHTVSSTA